MGADLSVFMFIGFGIAVGILLQSNYRLRNEVHQLRTQVAQLTTLLINLGVNTNGDDQSVG